MRDDLREAAEGIRRIRALLTEVYTDEGVHIWLHARNRSLGGQVPAELMSVGATEDVLRLAQQLADGNFA